MLNGWMGTGVIQEMGGEEARLCVTFDTPPPPPADVTLVCALPRPKFLRRVLLSATTMGVKQVYLIKTWRVDKSYWQTPLLGPETMHALLVEGLEQCRDTRMPAVHLRRAFRPFVEDELPGLVQQGAGVALHPGEERVSLCALGRPLVVLLGPEGGFIPWEVAMLRGAGCRIAGLGPRVLRVEDAVASVLGMCILGGG